MIILGIETSCDETAASIVEDGRRIRSSKVASQIDIHHIYGGVVPEIASRKHLEESATVHHGKSAQPAAVEAERCQRAHSPTPPTSSLKSETQPGLFCLETAVH